MMVQLGKISESILIELHRAVKTFELFPPDHPSLKAILGTTFQDVKKVLSVGQVTISVEKDSFFEKNEELLKDEKMFGFAEGWGLRGISEITFAGNLSFGDWINFVKFLSTDAHTIMNTEGVEQYFVKEGIKGLSVKGEGENSVINDKVTAAAWVREQEGFEDSEGGNGHIGMEDDIETLLNVLRGEDDKERYEEVLRLLIEKGARSKANYMVDDFIRILYALSVHSTPDSGCQEWQRKDSYSGVRYLFDSEAAKMLIDRYCTLHRSDRSKAKVVMLRIGGDMAPYLLNELNKSQDIKERKELFNLIVEFGEMARKHIEKRLKTNTWYIARQMVSLLGFIGSPSSFNALKASLGHEDIRVQKEAVKALARINNEKSTDELIKLIFSNNPDLSLQAVLSLGAMGKKAAAPALIGFVKRRDPLGRKHEIKKEAVKALGDIGDPSALPLLSSIAKKRTYWTKEHEEIKSLAADSIYKIRYQKT